MILAIGYFALLPALGYLFRATKARRPELPRAVLILALIGPALLGVAAIIFQIALTSKAGRVRQRAATTRATRVDQVTKAGLLRGVQILHLPGTLCLAFALVLLALNAMRAGLLTRFMGVLGIICGAALVLLPQNPIVVFWLLALAVLFAHRWPQGMPPAWETGAAVPWPSAASRSPSSARGRAATAPTPPEPSRCQNPDRQRRIRPRRSASASAAARLSGRAPCAVSHEALTGRERGNRLHGTASSAEQAEERRRGSDGGSRRAA